MSVLIKGLEMPSSCSKCSLVTEYYEGGLPVCCLLDKYADTSGFKLDDCPLVETSPFPEVQIAGEREYISRDAAICAAEGFCVTNGINSDPLIEAIASIPTHTFKGEWIDVSERWYLNGLPPTSTYKCSNCGVHVKGIRLKECPCCGVGMRME